MRKVLVYRVLFIMSVLGYALVASLAFAQTNMRLSYQLHGQVRSGAGMLTRPNPRQILEFIAWGDGQRWQITLWNSNLIGTSVVHITSGKVNPVKKTQTNVYCPYYIMAGGRGEPNYFGCYDRIATNRAVVYLTTDGPPYQYDTMSARVWLALGTVTYQGRSPDLPPAFPPHGRLYETEDDGRFRARWSRIEEPPHFVRRIVYMNRGYMLTPNAKGGDEQIRYGGAYSNGFEELVLQVQGTTNIGPYVFPLKYEIRRQGPGDASVGYGGLRVLNYYVIEITNIVLNAPPPREYPLPMVAKMSVNDYRLAGDTNIGVVSYAIPDGRWRTLAEVKKIHAARQALRKKPEPRPWLFAFLISLACAPFIILTWQNRRRKSSEMAVANVRQATSPPEGQEQSGA